MQHANAIPTHVTKRHKKLLFARKSTSSRSFCHISRAQPNGRELTQYRERRRTQDPPSANNVQPPDPLIATHWAFGKTPHMGHMRRERKGGRFKATKQSCDMWNMPVESFLQSAVPWLCSARRSFHCTAAATCLMFGRHYGRPRVQKKVQSKLVASQELEDASFLLCMGNEKIKSSARTNSTYT